MLAVCAISTEKLILFNLFRDIDHDGEDSATRENINQALSCEVRIHDYPQTPRSSRVRSAKPELASRLKDPEVKHMTQQHGELAKPRFHDLGLG